MFNLMLFNGSTFDFTAQTDAAPAQTFTGSFVATGPQFGGTQNE